MPRPNPLNRKLPKDWHEETLKILEIAACPKGSPSRKVAIEMLKHSKTEGAVKFLSTACERSGHAHPFRLYKVVLNKAFRVCIFVKASKRLRRKDAKKSESTYKAIGRVFEDTLAFTDALPFNNFSIYDRVSLYPNLKKLDNYTILDALLIVLCLFDAVSRAPKAHNTGRPPAPQRRGLSIYLANMFCEFIGTPVTGAVEGLVAATFSGKAE